jgi:hypothetical protein
MKKLLVALLASAFALTAFAQAPKSDTAPKAPAAEKKTEKKAKAKTEKKSKAKAEKKMDKKAETK